MHLRLRADHRSLPDQRRAGQDGPRLDARVLADLDPRVDEGARRIDDGDPGAHVPLRDLDAGQPLGLRQPDPVVDSHRQLGSRRRNDGHAPPVGHRHRDQVGEVVLPRRRGGHGRDVGAQPAGVEAVGPRVHFVDGAGGRIGRRLLHDRPDRAVGAPHHAAVAGRVGDPRGEERDAGTSVGLRPLQRDEELGGHERRVAHRHHHLPDLAGELRQPRPHGVGGAQLRLLSHAPCTIAEMRLDLVRVVTGDHHLLLDAGRGQRGQDVVEHRAARHRVQHLWQAGSHASSLAGGQHDRRGDGHDPAGSCAASAIISISTRAPFGSARTATVVARRVRRRQVARVRLVDGGEVGHVDQEDGRLHHPIEASPGRLEQRRRGCAGPDRPGRRSRRGGCRSRARRRPVPP